MRKVNLEEVLNFLEHNEIRGNDLSRLLGVFNKNINSFPIGEVIQTTPEGLIMVNGRTLDDLNDLTKFRQGIHAVRDNWAFQLLADQILFNAIKYGVHFGKDPDSVIFSRVAIWFITQFREYLNKFDN